MKETDKKDRKQSVSLLARTNYLLIVIGYLTVLTGFLLLTGPGTTSTHFEPDLFSVRRTAVAPAVTLAGFFLIGFGVLYPVRPSENESGTGSTHQHQS